MHDVTDADRQLNIGSGKSTRSDACRSQREFRKMIRVDSKRCSVVRSARCACTKVGDRLPRPTQTSYSRLSNYFSSVSFNSRPRDVTPFRFAHAATSAAARRAAITGLSYAPAPGRFLGLVDKVGCQTRRIEHRLALRDKVAADSLEAHVPDILRIAPGNAFDIVKSVNLWDSLCPMQIMDFVPSHSESTAPPIGDALLRRKSDNAIHVASEKQRNLTTILKRKWNSADVTSDGPVRGYERKGRRIASREHGERVVLETCVRCNIEKELTPEFFTPTRGASAVLNKPMGQESFINSKARGCHVCYRVSQTQKRSSGRTYVVNILAQPQYADLDYQWYVAQKEQQGNMYKTFNLLQISEDANCAHRVGIHNEGGTIIHDRASCVLDPAAMNVTEGDMLRRAGVRTLGQLWIVHIIPAILNALGDTSEASVVDEARCNLRRTTRQNGVITSGSNRDPIVRKTYNRELRDKDFNVQLANVVSRHKHHDRVGGFSVHDGHYVDRLYIWKLFIAQSGRCAYSNVPFSLERGTWQHFSVERIDNTVGHERGNCVLILRCFNTCGNVRSNIWTWLPLQNHVSLTEWQLQRCMTEARITQGAVLECVQSNLDEAFVSDIELFNLTRTRGFSQRAHA